MSAIELAIEWVKRLDEARARQLLEWLQAHEEAEPVATAPPGAREMLGFAAERLMRTEVQVRTGVAYGERDLARLVQRNGYRARAWDTRVGQIEPAFPG